MASNSNFDKPENLLKNLALRINQNDPEGANKSYETLRNILLDKRYNESNANPRDVFDDFLNEKLLTQQYLKSTNPSLAKEFIDFAERIQNERSVYSLEPVRFVMAMGRKKNTDDNILQNVKIPHRIFKGKAPPPPDSGSSRLSSPSPASSSTSLRNSSSTGDVRSSSSVAGFKNEVASHSSVPSITLVNGALKRSSESRSVECLSAKFNEFHFNTDVGGGLSEFDIIEGLLYVWQGIHGKIFRRCERTKNYLLQEKWRIYPWVREAAENLATLGYLHDILVPFGEPMAESGIIRECFAGTVRDQLSRYYTLIATLRTEFQTQVALDLEPGGQKDFASLTLDSLRLQSMGVARTFMDLISIAEFTKLDKGGHLASGVFCFIKHGDPCLQNLVKVILFEICKPLYKMLMNWVLEGRLDDQKREFFIASDSSITGDRIWLEKYSIRTEMLPEFISVELAEKILSVGRSINFLRERCDNELPYQHTQKITQLFQSCTAEVMYLREEGHKLEDLVNRAYEETNQRVLDVLLNKYSLLSHFQAHRKFILLGQGDFIHHLMDLLMDVLEKAANKLHPHYLNSILDSAVRATSAQFEQEDIINRLDAATIKETEGEVGWDVFYLRYHVDGPIGTVFAPSCRLEYRKLFCALWKAKRIELILSKSWKHQITASKSLRKIGELAPVLRQCHEVTAEMLHFVRQTQYYFLFEVLECSWKQMKEDVQLAACLDGVIEAHTEFLEKVTAGVFMDETHQKLALQLRIIYDLVLSLTSHVHELLLAGEEEVRNRTAAMMAKSVDSGDSAKVDYLRKRRDFVVQFVPNAARGIRVLADTYRRAIKKFLLTLNSMTEMNLELLSIRLDFNLHYKHLDSSLEAPLTFQHRRMSSIGPELSPILTRKFSMERRYINKRSGKTGTTASPVLD